jgi:serine/threonine-protein kinase RsbW
MRSEEFNLSIPSSTGSIYLVEKFIEDVCDRFNLTNNYFGNISLSLMEAVDNAINHGNRNNVEKAVSIRLDVDPGILKFTVKDEGDGFNNRDIPDPTDPLANGTVKIGRGLFIIKRMSDEVVFNNKGNEITMIFKISGISEKTFREREKKLQSYTSRVGKKITNK